MGDVCLCSCPCSGSDLERETRTEGKWSFCSNPRSGSGSRLGGPCMQMSRPIQAFAGASTCPICPSGSLPAQVSVLPGVAEEAPTHL